MKKEMNPAVAVAVVVAVVAIVGFLIWRGTSGGGANVPPGGVGNRGPFSPGGEMAGGAGAQPGVRPPAGAPTPAPGVPAGGGGQGTGGGR